jgi:predicted Ser/Thr protein kinase
VTESGIRICPYCSEEIKSSAVKCKHCQSMLDGTAPPPTSATGSAPPPGAGTSPGQGEPAWWYLSGPLEPGTRIREYTIVKMLGKGGMGEVYLAQNEMAEQTVALKVISPEVMRSAGMRARFLEEARVMSRMRHPNVVQLYSFFEEGNRLFMAMEFIQGQSLEDLLDERPLEWQEAVDIARQVLGGLAYAHSLPETVVHRDIKPDNVLLGQDGRARIIDFGVARAMDREKMTKTGAAVGTYEYMSPEQVRGVGVRPAADVYAMGITLYKMLAGVVPFPQETDGGYDCMRAQVEKAPPPLKEFREGIPEWLQRVLNRSLAKAVEDRFANAQEMLDALENRGEGLAELVVDVEAETAVDDSRRTAPPASPVAPPAKNRVPWLVAGVGVVAVLVAIAVAVPFGGGKKQEAKKDEKKAYKVEKREEGKAYEAERKEGKKAHVAERKVEKVAAGDACLADCASKKCGPDGCGGSCGSCAIGKECSPQGLCRCAGETCRGECCSGEQECTPRGCCERGCKYRECGEDGCGGSCGSCSTGETCEDGTCRRPSLKRLGIRSASATDWNYRYDQPERYGPPRLLDGDTSTAWCKTNGTGETLTFEFYGTVNVHEIRVRNGYQKYEPDKYKDRFYRNSRVRMATVCAGRDQCAHVSFDDSKPQQTVHNFGGALTRSATIKPTEGTWGQDRSLCISEVEIWGTD